MKSILERGNNHREQTQTGLCFGRITRVYPEQRMCEVKTFGADGIHGDNHIGRCQWLSSDANPDGDESTVIPRLNAYCVVGFINGEPFIIGFFKPLNDTGHANITDGVEEEINEGDKSTTTIGGNKVILRASGEIQIESTSTCKTVYFPKGHLINHLCRNYEFATDGGTVEWVQYDSGLNTLETVKRTEIRDDSKRSNIIFTEAGTIIKGNPLIYSRQIGKGVEGIEIEDVVHTTEIKNTGETDVFIRAAGNDNGHKLNIKPSGETTLDICGKSVTKMLPTGDTSIDVNGKANVSIKADGTTTISVGPGKSVITIKPDGNIELVATTKVKVKAPKVELNGSASGITTKNSHQGVIDLISGAPVTPSSTVFSDI